MVYADTNNIRKCSHVVLEKKIRLLNRKLKFRQETGGGGVGGRTQ